ncbi:5926_t:CDS:2 [Dentiscutata erythropus]|uniref:5926_t:CDS:1 n=1 Tax=Dentiscutata erythropus TaxID=1348616 RepID=A0A9N9FA78_9GLOM|nr:5926_t:CDS:2 [Dentiscutata erythropus]
MMKSLEKFRRVAKSRDISEFVKNNNDNRSSLESDYQHKFNKPCIERNYEINENHEAGEEGGPKKS